MAEARLSAISHPSSVVNTKKCQGCPEMMVDLDSHDLCMFCLTTAHNSSVCEDCKALPLPIFSARMAILGDVILNGRWPDDWKKQLAEAQMTTWFPSGSSPLLENLSGKRPCESDHGSLSEESRTKKPKSKRSKPTKKQSEEAWKRSMEGNIATILTMITELKSSAATPVTKVTPQEESEGHETGEEDPPDPHDLSITHILDTSIGHRDVTICASTLRPPPSTRIPRIQDRDKHEEASLYSEPEDLGRTEKRRLHLSGLRDLCPKLAHADLTTDQGSSYFSMMTGPNKTKHSDLCMPFLPEVFQAVADSSEVSVSKGLSSSAKISKYYPTTQPAESGILQPRVIPKDLLTFVSPASLQEVGASGRKAHLKKGTAEGNKEAAAVESHKQACSYLRLANNTEIGVDVASSLLDKAQASVDEALSPSNVPAKSQYALLDLHRTVALLRNTVFDLKSTNNDLMQAVVSQYNHSVTDRREAWLSASSLPKGTVNELKLTDLPKPSLADPEQPLSLFGSVGSQVLQEQAEILKEQRRLDQMRKSVQPSKGPQNNASSRGGQSNRRSRGGFRGRGRGRHNKSQGRGGHSQGNKQSFPKDKPQNKQD